MTDTSSSIPPTLRIAARSTAVRPYLPILVELYESLDVREFRKPPICLVADHLSLSERHVYRAVRTLIDLGFLETGPRLGNALTVRLAVPHIRAA